MVQSDLVGERDVEVTKRWEGEERNGEEEAENEEGFNSLGLVHQRLFVL